MHKPHLTPEQIAAALYEAGGVAAGAARRLGCDATSIARYLKRYPELRAAAEEGRRMAAEARRAQEESRRAAEEARQIEKKAWRSTARIGRHNEPLYDVDAMADALRQAGGVIRHAARIMGCTDRTVVRYKARYPAVQAAFDEAWRGRQERGEWSGADGPRQHRARLFGSAEVADAVRQARGDISGAARILGCSQRAASNYVARDPIIAEAHEQAQAELVDLVSCRLAEAVNRGEWGAVVRVLQTMDTEYGFGMRDEPGQDAEGAPLPLPPRLQAIGREVYGLSAARPPAIGRGKAGRREKARLEELERRYAAAARAAGCPQDQWWNLRRAGYIGQPHQLRFHAACREADRDAGPSQIGFGGARGPGKSHAMLAQLALDDCQREPGLKCLLLRRVGKALAEQVDDLRLKVLAYTPHHYRRGEGSIEFPNGSRIRLGHFQNESDIDAYLGLEYDVIGIEEATTLTHSKYRAILTCNRTSKDEWRPRLYATTNPGGAGHTWFKATFVTPSYTFLNPSSPLCRTLAAATGGNEGAAPTTRFIPATVDDNRFLNPEYAHVLDDLPSHLRRAWRYGDWDAQPGQFFSTFRRNIHVFSPGRMEDWKNGRLEGAPSNLPAFQPSNLPPDWTPWLAMDYGFTQHTVILLLALDRDDRVYVLDEHAERQWLVPRHAEAVRAMLGRWGIAAQRVACFVAGPECFDRRPQRRDEGTIAAQWERAGFFLRPANPNRLAGAAEVLRRLGDPDPDPDPVDGHVDAPIAPTLFISDRCARLLDCLPVLESDPRYPEQVRAVDADADGLGGDDAYDALRYGLLAIVGDRGT